ncbi:endonuclease/exonuclease/phosphatase family protein [Alteromonas halophila]|uniref:Endonuclease n=1 Tax=Alteromonas halophila TaxID=516698 RepID=A0A918N0C7_9ALTE|nr:endonuclease/exonuclease/phosphatase family protein [Alteromonas halophila]GGW93349.1 endonuclease [Alteromonas halophila]
MCRIVSYNIHSGVGTDKKQDYQRIGSFLKQCGADIVLLQEMDTRPAERTVEQDIAAICAADCYQLVSSPALYEKTGWYGNAVLTRYPVLHKETVDVSQHGFQPRNIQAVMLDTPGGPLTVINTHKGLKKHERRSQFALLHEYIESQLAKQPTPLVLGGDFNEWQFFTSAFKHLNDTLIQYRLGPTFPSRFPLFSLDRLWTTNDVQVRGVKKLKNAQTRVLSDHLPVQIDIALPRSSSEFDLLDQTR